MDDDFVDFRPITPVWIDPADDIPDHVPEAPARRRPAPGMASPPYTLAAVAPSTVTTRGVKVAIAGFSLGAIVVTFFSWFGRRRV